MAFIEANLIWFIGVFFCLCLFFFFGGKTKGRAKLGKSVLMKTCIKANHLFWSDTPF